MPAATAELVEAARSDSPLSANGTVDSTVFRAFEVDEFREWPAWLRLERILRSNGGSYGLSGARGAGKSWLMLRSVEWVKTAPETGRLGGIGLWYPSPSEYDSHAFLASLSDSFGTEIDRWYRRHPGAQRFALIARLYSPFVGLIVGIAAAVGVSAQYGAAAGVGAGVAVALVVAALLRLLVRSLSPYRREASLAAEAKLVRERARYSITRRETTELAAEGGHGLTGRLRTERARELVERPATLSSLVNDFRALAAEAGDVAGRVVIAIDELDKMVDPQLVNQLLRDIKGVFEVPHVHFLVSVSDEAARSLSLGALFVRDVFNSSFYTVLEVVPTSPDALADLLQKRSNDRIPHDVALAMGVLSGGNPREAIRLAELAGDSRTGMDAICGALREEAFNLRREVVTAQDPEDLPGLGDDVRVRAFSSLSDSLFDSADQLSGLAGDALEAAMWDPEWSDETFEAVFGEPWRRLMVRLAVASQLIGSRSLAQDPRLALRLRDVIVAASQSARVARTVLERELRIESEAPAANTDDARRLLSTLAAEYEHVRKSERSGAPRTRNMDRIAARVRTLARDAAVPSDELGEMLASGGSGDRMVALAIVQTTADPAAFDQVLSAVRKPRTPFEGYQALLALETLLTGLNGGQRRSVQQALDSKFVDTLAKQDPPRGRLAHRILRTLEASAKGTS